MSRTIEPPKHAIRRASLSTYRSFWSLVSFLLFSALAFAFFLTWHQIATDRRFADTLSSIQRAVDARTLAITSVVSTIASVDQSFLGLSSNEFASLATNMQDEYDINRIVFAPVVNVSDQFEFEMNQEIHGLHGFQVRDVVGKTVPRGMRGNFVAPIVQIEPFDPHIAGLVGVDLLSSPTLKEYAIASTEDDRSVVAIAQTLGDALPRITEPTIDAHRLDSRVESERLMLVVVRAVYRGSMTLTSTTDRLQHWRGVYVSFASLDALWDAMQSGFEAERVAITVGTASDDDRVSVRNRDDADRYNTGLIYIRSNFDDRGLRGRYRVEAAYSTPFAKILSASLLAGIVGSLVFAVIFYAVAARARAKEISERAAIERLRAEQTLAVVGDAVVRLNMDFELTYANEMARRIFGDDITDHGARHLQQLLTPVVPTELASELTSVDNTVDTGGALVDGDYVFTDAKTGDTMLLNIQCTETDRIEGEDGAWIFVIRDVGIERAMADELLWRANRDELTSLLNRYAFEARATEILESDPDGVHAFCALDLDQFKAINDSAGHFIGDNMLQRVAETLLSEIRSTDIVARLGGDEFGFILRNVNRASVEAINRRIVAAVRGCRVSHGDTVFQVGASIGVALTDSSTKDVQELMHNADKACFVAKQRGRGRSVVFRADDVHINQRESDILWINEIPKALDENRFVLDVQPMVALKADARPKEIREVLLRMISADGSIVNPGLFIPAAERNGQMSAIDRWVIANGFAKIGRIPFDHGGVMYSINLSPRTLDESDLEEFVVEQLSTSGVSPSQICFELTETAAVSDVGVAASFLNSMRELGCRTALDDFGSGVASFRYLRSFPADYLKLDRSLIVEAGDDESSRRLLEGVAALAQDLGMATVAEGIENDDMYTLVADVGIDYVQGFHVQRPMRFLDAPPSEVDRDTDRHGDAPVVSTRSA